MFPFPRFLHVKLNTAALRCTCDRYVYVPKFESGGSFFPKVFRRWIFALFTAQATMIGMCLLKQGFKQAYSMMFLMALTYAYKVTCVGVATALSKLVMTVNRLKPARAFYGIS